MRWPTPSIRPSFLVGPTSGRADDVAAPGRRWRMGGRAGVRWSVRSGAGDAGRRSLPPHARSDGSGCDAAGTSGRPGLEPSRRHGGRAICGRSCRSRPEPRPQRRPTSPLAGARSSAFDYGGLFAHSHERPSAAPGLWVAGPATTASQPSPGGTTSMATTARSPLTKSSRHLRRGGDAAGVSMALGRQEERQAELTIGWVAAPLAGSCLLRAPADGADPRRPSSWRTKGSIHATG